MPPGIPPLELLQPEEHDTAVPALLQGRGVALVNDFNEPNNEQ